MSETFTRADIPIESLGLNPVFYENRVGIVEITDEVMFSDELPQVLKLLYDIGGFIVVRAEKLMHKRAMSYIAFSPLFDSIEKWEEPPMYLVEVHKNEFGELDSAKFVRCS